MTGWLFAMAIIVAVTALAVRKRRRQGLRRRIEALPGRTAASAVKAPSFREMDDLVQRYPCACGGKTMVRGERSEFYLGHELRVVRVECSRCEDTFSLYFDLSALPH